MAGFIGIVAFILLILFAIFFHELGHFVTARWAGVKVSKFFIGFGPTLWSTRRGRVEVLVGADGSRIHQPETEYGVKAFPIGGFVKIVGMSPMEEVPPEDQPRAFGAAPAWKRAIVLVAGSATHFVTAFVVLFLIFAAVGVPAATLTIGGVVEQLEDERSPAARAGLRKGDRIVEVNGEKIDEWGQVGARIRARGGDPVTVAVEQRDGRIRTVRLEPVMTRQDGQRVPVVGIEPAFENHREGPIGSIAASGRAMSFLVSTFFRQVPTAFRPDTLGLTGDGPTNERPFSIIGAGRIAGSIASNGTVVDFLGLFVQINIFIAIFNMLPLPPLDGGHLLVLGIEKIRGKPVSPRTVMPVAVVVASILLLLGVLLAYYDIVQPPQLPPR